MLKKIFLFQLLSFILSHEAYSQKDDGFRGIWYHIGNTKNEYVHKYSGGLGTYPANHYPFSVYSKKAKKTFFCFGGASKDSIPSLLHEIAYFDHQTKMVSKPTIILDKKTGDAHDNPVLNIDNDGFIWIFSTSHGVERPSYIHKSKKPFDISEFEKIEATRIENNQKIPFDNFSYFQIYYQQNNSFLGLMTHYENGMLKFGKNKQRRTIGFITSKNGKDWSEIKDLGIIEEGHYQTSGIQGKKVATTFNFHPNTENAAGLDFRTNLYYLQTTDFGINWKTVDNQNITLPLSEINNNSLVKNYQKEGLNVYINDLEFDESGNPVILYITSKGPDPGPQNAPYTLRLAHWKNSNWNFQEITTTDHNYDMGSLYLEGRKWRTIAPTEPSPQAYNTGGEVVLWESINEGKTWKKVKQLTKNSQYNHSYPRKPINTHPDFYAFWADGHGRKKSESSFYFANKNGKVFKLPTKMKHNLEKPLHVKF